MYYILFATFITDCTWCYVYYRLHNIGYLYYKLSTIPTCTHVWYLNGCQHYPLLATSITYKLLPIQHINYPSPSLHVISSLLCLPILRLTCVADFGLSNVFYGDTSLSTQCGSPAYAAPEILNNQKYGPAVDIWSM